MVSVHSPLAEGLNSKTVPQPPIALVQFPVPPNCVVPKRLPAVSKTKPPVTQNPSMPSQLKLWSTVCFHPPASGDNSNTMPLP